MAKSLFIEGKFRLQEQTRVIEYARYLLPETEFSGDLYSEQSLNIATGATATLKPQDVFPTKVTSFVLVADGEVSVYQAPVFPLPAPLSITGRVFVLCNSDALGFALDDITVQNNTVADVNVTVFMVGD